MDQPSEIKDATSSENDIQDEASSSSNHNLISQDELFNFREQWQRELEISLGNVSGSRKGTTPTAVDDDIERETQQEVEARCLFLKGTDMERSGKFYEAIQFYRKAIQMVPNIEMKLRDVAEIPKQQHSKNEMFESYSRPTSEQDFVDNNPKKYDLVKSIRKKVKKASSICSPKWEQKSTHISDLPVELILYILKWVVSSELDLRSLEMFGQVCRGFYLCARDSEIWKLACHKVWGSNCSNKLEHYINWRQMYINMARLRFNGLYINKTTYIRQGENSFQDQFYKPWHLVTYYRYFRFFPEGIVLMLTSADEPRQCLSQLRYRNSKIPVLSGYYRLTDEHVTLIVNKNDSSGVQIFKRQNKTDIIASSKQTLQIEFQIMNHRNRKHTQLRWIHYSIRTQTKTGQENVCVFDLEENKFPNLVFSLVKSYAMESENMLT